MNKTKIWSGSPKIMEILAINTMPWYYPVWMRQYTAARYQNFTENALCGECGPCAVNFFYLLWSLAQYLIFHLGKKNSITGFPRYAAMYTAVRQYTAAYWSSFGQICGSILRGGSILRPQYSAVEPDWVGLSWNPDYRKISQKPWSLL